MFLISMSDLERMLNSRILNRSPFWITDTSISVGKKTLQVIRSVGIR
jgi:hypothetical protein